MSDERSLLDIFFSEQEQNAETFADVLKREGILIDPEAQGRFSDDRPDQIKTPEFKDQMSGFVRINHGWHNEDYVFHISHHPKRPWRASTDAMIRLIAQTMNTVIPNNVQVKIWKPYGDWDIAEITFKAFSLREHWAITDKVMDDLVLELFELLNKTV